ncbi:RNA-3'-phosphate cyclase family protein [Aspergillus luchuensis]|uniref:RNA-3'-phosphate cyclase family protein n=1 Tax=Aspergillus kawachii TaxID=1069201 RepID=A0A146FGL2_ASPKA|nr:RNA-3'-phosphate cyclase family protein [Aspergillus luchuensis]
MSCPVGGGAAVRTAAPMRQANGTEVKIRSTSDEYLRRRNTGGACGKSSAYFLLPVSLIVSNSMGAIHLPNTGTYSPMVDMAGDSTVIEGEDLL